MKTIYTSIPIEPDRREDALEFVERLVDQSQKEKGVIDYLAAVDVQDPNVIRFVERYRDAEAHERHVRTEHYRTFVDRLPDLVAGPIETVQFELDGSPKTVRFDVDDLSET